MVEFQTLNKESLTSIDKDKLTFFLCDEGAITCRTFRELAAIIKDSGYQVVLAMPEDQFLKGKRGWAKVNILASVSEGRISFVYPVSYEEVLSELDSNWAVVTVNGALKWRKEERIEGPKIKEERLQIMDTSSEEDLTMMDLARKTIGNSNCWLDPAGCVFAKDGYVLVASTSLNYNDARCTEIPFTHTEIALDQGERLLFCDSQHAERVGIARAAREGITLSGSTMYVTKFPCRACVVCAVEAGINTIVFERESYGLLETADLIRHNKILVKRVID